MKMRKKLSTIICLFSIIAIFMSIHTVSALAANQEISYKKGDNTLNISFEDDFDQDSDKPIVWSQGTADWEYTTSISIQYDYSFPSKEALTVKLASSNPSVGYFKSETLPIGYMNTDGYLSGRGYGTKYVSLYIKSAGKTTVSISVGSQTISKTIYIVPQNVAIQKILQPDASHIQLTWNAYPTLDGYLIRCCEEIKEQKNGYYTMVYKNFKTIATVDGGAINKVSIPISNYSNYYYEVVGFVKMPDGSIQTKELTEQATYFTQAMKAFQPKIMNDFLLGVKKNSNKTVKITWQTDEATSYKIYRKVGEKGTYSLLKAFNNDKYNSYIDTVTAGKLYFYKIEKKYANGLAITSREKIGYIPIKSKAVQMKLQKKINQDVRDGRYAGYAASPDRTYYYEVNGKYNVVNVVNQKLEIVTLDSKMNQKKKKTVKLGKFDKWGGFYHGADGNFYVVVGFSNIEEKKDKVVLNVYKYDKNWKKKKTCSIKSNIKNSFDGVVEPIRAGNCSMTLINDTLYVFTARTMFKHSDGLNHQSNIAIQINTKTMKYQNNNQSYCSHSFNQFVDYQDGNLYLLDHGDAYPRAIKLTVTDGYQTKAETTKSYNIFELEGATGANYTGATIGGMAIGAKNIMVCGTSLPQKYKVGGVTGNSGCVTENVFVITADRDTGASKINWITQLNPKSSKTQVLETRIVRIKEDRFVLLYSTKTGEKQKLNYLVLSENGKVLKKKTYSNVHFDASSQPVIYNGYIQWTAAKYEGNSWYDFKKQTKSYRIPVQL